MPWLGHREEKSAIGAPVLLKFASLRSSTDEYIHKKVFIQFDSEILKNLESNTDSS